MNAWFVKMQCMQSIQACMLFCYASVALCCYGLKTNVMLLFLYDDNSYEIYYEGKHENMSEGTI